MAELLDTSVASVNSALQRARATLATVDVDDTRPNAIDAEQPALLTRYVEAFERYDIPSLVALLHEEATFSMPPYALWLRGRHEVSNWMLGPGRGCRDSRVVTTAANGCAAFGSYRPAGPGAHEPWSLVVLEIWGGRIVAVNNFLDTKLFAAFGLPPRL